MWSPCTATAARRSNAFDDQPSAGHGHWVVSRTRSVGRALRAQDTERGETKNSCGRVRVCVHAGVGGECAREAVQQTPDCRVSCPPPPESLGPALCRHRMQRADAICVHNAVLVWAPRRARTWSPPWRRPSRRAWASKSVPDTYPTSLPCTAAPAEAPPPPAPTATAAKTSCGKKHHRSTATGAGAALQDGGGDMMAPLKRAARPLRPRRPAARRPTQWQWRRRMVSLQWRGAKGGGGACMASGREMPPRQTPTVAV